MLKRILWDISIYNFEDKKIIEDNLKEKSILYSIISEDEKELTILTIISDNTALEDVKKLLEIFKNLYEYYPRITTMNSLSL